MKSMTAAILLCAILALSVQVANADYQYQWKHDDHNKYTPIYVNKYYTGYVHKDFVYVKSYVDPKFYTTCSKYEEPKKANILICLLSNKCYEYAEEPCCTHDGYEYKHACFAKCFGYTTYYPGKCVKHNPPPVSLPPVYGPKCGKYAYCKVNQQCCSNYGYKTCCDKYSTCCGPLCCGKDQKCEVTYFWDGHYKKTKYTCKNKVVSYPPHGHSHSDDKYHH